MVETIIKYACSHCRQRFDTEEQAEKCEGQGVDPIAPIGTVFQYSEEMVFAIIKQGIGVYSGHKHAYSCWACRDTPAGDNTGDLKKGFCGWDSCNKMKPPIKTMPAYKRMIAALESNGIKPIDYKELEE